VHASSASLITDAPMTRYWLLSEAFRHLAGAVAKPKISRWRQMTATPLGKKEKAC